MVKYIIAAILFFAVGVSAYTIYTSLEETSFEVRDQATDNLIFSVGNGQENTSAMTLYYGTRTNFSIYMGAMADGTFGLSMGTTRSYPFKIFTNNIDRLTIDSVGNVHINGALRLNNSRPLRPVCNEDMRGGLYTIRAGSGAADAFQICMKTASDLYEWRNINVV